MKACFSKVMPITLTWAGEGARWFGVCLSKERRHINLNGCSSRGDIVTWPSKGSRWRGEGEGGNLVE